MPIYEYECPTCGRFEVMESVSAKPLTACPQCAENGKKNKVQRVISESAFHLKGGGWYKTDYSGKSSGNASSSKSESTSTESKSETKSDSGSSESKGKKSLKVTGNGGSGGGGCGGGCSCH